MISVLSNYNLISTYRVMHCEIIYKFGFDKGHHTNIEMDKDACRVCVSTKAAFIFGDFIEISI